MNNIFRVIWNKSTQSWVAVSELARGQVKSSTTSNVDVKKSKIAVSVMGALALASAVEVQAATVVNTAAVNAGNIYIETNAGTTNNVLIGKTATVSSTGHYDVVAIGKNSQAQGPSAIAIGSTSKAKGDAVAIGLNANSSANYSVSIGKNAASKAEGGISIGHGANVTSAGANGTAIGAGSKALNINATALGASANASNTNATAIGSGAIASNKSATAIGHSANASNINATAIGFNATARSVNATALGTNATARNVDATAIGTNATASNVNATALGTNATASRDNAIAIGLDSKASNTNATALGVNATAAGTNVTAIGINSYAKSDNATALGPHANASAANSTAIGPGAIAKGVNGVALGVGALANATSTLALGENAMVKTGNSVAIGKDSKAEGQGDLVAIGTSATAGARDTIALGRAAMTSSDGAVAIGRDSKATASDAFAAGANATGAGPRSITIGNYAETTTAAADGIALGSHVNASGSAAIAIGKSTKATAEVALAMVDGANASGPKSIAIGQNSKTTASQAVAIGATSQATATDAFALGSSAVASHANSVALGSRSTTNDPANEASNQFYTFKDDSGSSQREDFAANRVGSIVSVGAANAERQIHHVGAGRISPTSTDAINGSQLYHVLNKSGFNVLNGTTSVSRINNDGKVAFYNGNYTTVEVEQLTGGNAAKIKYNVKTQDIASENATAISPLPNTPEEAGLATAATVVAAINKAGFKIDTNNDGNPENIVNGDTLVIAKKGENIEVSRTDKKIEIGITETPTFKNVSIVNSDGGNTAKAENISAKKGAGNLDAGEGDKNDRLVYTDSAGEEQPVATMNDGLKFTGNNEKEINSHKLNSVVKIVGERDDGKTAYDDDSAKNNIIVQADGNDTLTVKLAKDLVHLKSVTTEDAEGNKSVMNATGITITPIHRGDAGSLTGTGSPVSLTNTGLNNGGNVITNVAGHLPGAVTNHAAPETYGKLPDDWDKREIKDNIKNDAATVGDVLNAGWNLKGPQEASEGGDEDHVDFVRAYDSVKFRHGKNTRVSVGTNETKTENTIKFDVDLPVAYTDEDGTPLAQGEDGTYYKVDVDGNITNEAATGDVKISLLNPETKQGENNKTGEPVTLTNLKDNIGVDKTVVPHTEGQPLTKPQNFDAETNGRNAATVNDVLNAGWNAYVTDATDDNFKALVNPTDKVVFKGENGVTVSAEKEEEGVTTFKFSADTTELTPIAEGTDKAGSITELSDEDGKKLVNASTVAAAINNAGFTLKASAVENQGTRDTNSTKDENGELINSGDTVEMIAGKNMSVKHDENGKITYATKDEVEFTSVQFGDGGPKIQRDGTTNNIKFGDNDGSPISLTNLKNNIGGDATDVPHTAGEPLTKPQNFDVETNGRNAATVNDVLNAGWNAYVNDTTDGNFKALVNPTDKVVFKGENGVVVTAEEEDQGVTTFNFSVNTTALQGSSPITYVNENGDKLIKTPDNKFYKADDIVNGKPKEDAAEQTPAGHKLVDNNGNVTTPSTLGNVAGTLTPSYNKGNPKVADSKADKDDEAQVGDVTKQVINPFNATSPDAATAEEIAKVYNNAATVGDVLNSGWNLKNNGEAKDFVKPYDTVNFVNGLGTIATVETNDAGELSNIRIDTLTTLVDSEGNLVTQIGNDFYKVEDIDPKTGKPKENATPITVDDDHPLSVKVVNPTKKENTTKTTNPIQMGNIAEGTKTLDGSNRGDKLTDDGPTEIDEATNPNMKAAYNGLADLKNSNQTNVMTVADAQKLGWVVSSNKTTGALADEYADDVRNANEVRFVGTGAAIVSGKTNEDVRTVTVTVQNNLFNYEVTKLDGSEVKTVVGLDGNVYAEEDLENTTFVDGKYYKTAEIGPDGQPSATANPVVPAPNNEAEYKTVVKAEGEKPRSVTNIAGTLTPSYNKGNPKVADGTADKDDEAQVGDVTKQVINPFNATSPDAATAEEIAKVYNNAATVGDVLNSGWNLQGNGSAVDFVKPYDTVNFVDGTGTTVVAEASEDGKTSTIKINTSTQYTDGNGTPVTVIDGKGYPVGSVKGPDDKVYPKGTEFNEDGSPKNGETAINPTTENPQVSLVGKDGTSTTSIVLGNVAAGTNTLDGTNRGDKTTAEGPTVIDANTNPNMKAAYNGLADLKNSNQTNVMTVADAQKLGWVVSSNKTTGALADEYADDVRNANEVRFVGTGLATVSGKTDGEVRTITVDVDAQKVAEAAQLPVVYTDKQGNKLVKGEDGKFYPADSVVVNGKHYPKGSVVSKDGKVYPEGTAMDDQTGNPVDQTATEVTALEPKETGDVIASMNNAEGSTTNTMALTNVSGNLPVTYNLGDNEIVDDKPTGDKITEKTSIYDEQEAPTADEVKAMYNNAATVGDVLNAGWNLQNNGEAKDFVKPYDKVNFVNGVGTIAKVTIDESGKKSDVTFDIDKGELSAKDTGALQGTTPEALKKLKEAVTAAEQPITDAKAELAEKQAALEAAKQELAKDQDNETLKDRVVEAEKAVDAANQEVAKAEKAKKDAEAAVAAVPNKVATVENVVKAVNDSGFTIFQDNAEAANKKALVNPGDKVVYAADGLAEVEVANETQDGVTTITYKINAQKVAETAQLPVVYTDKQGNKLVKGEDGFYPADSVVVNGKHYPKDSVVSKDGKVYPKDTPMDAQTGLPTDQNATEETALTPKAAGDVIASMNNAGNETTTPMALSNVGQGTNTIGDKKKDDETLVKVGNNYYKPADLTNGVPNPNAQPVTDGTDIAQADAPVDFAKAGLADLANSNPNNALTVADARNFGWVVSTSNNKYAQAVKNAQVVDFKGYGGVEVDGKTEDGKYIIEIGLSDAGKLKAEELKNTEAGTATTSPTGRIEVDKNAGGFVSAQNVAEVINASGFKLKASEAAGGSLDQAGSATKDLANGATKATSTKGELINPGDTIDMVAGKNMTVKHDAEGRITYSTKDDVSFNTVSLDQTDQDGNKVENKPTVKLKNEQGTKVNNNKEGAKPAENPNALNISSVGTGPDAKPQNTQLTGVGSVLNTKAVTTNPGTEKPADATAEADKKLVDLVGTKDAPIADTVLDSAATVRDLAHMGWVVSASNEDGTENYSDTVKNANKVDFKGENGISVTGKTSATGVREITIALAEGDVIKPNEFVITKEGEEPITAIEVVDNGVKKYYAKDNIDPTTGKPKPGTDPIEITADHKVENKGAGFVTGNKVAKAIQESGFTVGKAKAETTPATYGNADEKVNPDDELRFADGSNTKVSVGTVKAANADGSFSTTTTVKVDVATAEISNNSDGSVKGSFENKEKKEAAKAVVDAAKEARKTAQKTFDEAVKALAEATTPEDKLAKAQELVAATTTLKNAEKALTDASEPFNKVATVENVVDAINGSGFTLKTSATDEGKKDSGEDELINPGKTVEMVAGKNMAVKQEANGKITYATKDKVEFTEVTVKDVDGNSVVTNGKGITINNGIAGKPVSLTQNGLDNGGNRIVNVAKGVDPTDAVNVSQLKDEIGGVNNRINKTTRDLRAGIAGSNAAAGLPQVYIPGKSMVAASVGTFKGENALAVGYSRASDNGKIILKLQGNANTRGDIGGSVGVGYQW